MSKYTAEIEGVPPKQVWVIYYTSRNGVHSQVMISGGVMFFEDEVVANDFANMLTQINNNHTEGGYEC